MIKKGFTLIELLIAGAIMALVSLAIMAVFGAGLSVYERVRGYNDSRTNILLAIEKMERDLRNTINITGIDFKGTASKVTFPALVRSQSGKEGYPAPGSISYYIDNSTHYIVSEEKDYSAATLGEESGRGVITQLVYADKIELSYYHYDPKTSAYLWSDIWDKDTGRDSLVPDESAEAKKDISVNTPLGVRIKISLDGPKGTAITARTVFFPLAVSLRIAGLAVVKEDAAGKGVSHDPSPRGMVSGVEP